MKKKLILLPITLTALTPMVSMVGCNKINFKDYQVTDEEFVQIISLTDVKLIQADTKEYNSMTGEVNSEMYDECSDNVYHSITKSYISDPNYTEEYVMRHSGEPDTYTKIERYDPQGQWEQEVGVGEFEFWSVKRIGDQFTFYYNYILQSSTFSFNKNKKCYFGMVTDDKATVMFEYYFYKKSLIQFNMFQDDKQISEMKLKYQEIIPVPPDPRNP